MAFKYYGNLVFSTGEYEKDGETKKRWSKAGAVFKDTETGKISIKFDAMPVGEWSGWMRVFEDDKNKTDTVLNVDSEPINLDNIGF